VTLVTGRRAGRDRFFCAINLCDGAVFGEINPNPHRFQYLYSREAGFFVTLKAVPQIMGWLRARRRAKLGACAAARHVAFPTTSLSPPVAFQVTGSHSR
jgi:hypothetical protein